MATQQEIDAKIAELDELIQSGETSTTVDGTTSQIDLEALRNERDDLRAKSKCNRLNRPRIASVNLSGAMG